MNKEDRSKLLAIALWLSLYALIAAVVWWVR